MFARLIAPELLPEDTGRILYLDCDTIIEDNICELETIAMDKPVMMRADCIHNRYTEFIGLPKNSKYYNSGIMLINITEWKKKQCTESIMNHIQNVSTCYNLIDQDLINLVLKDEIEDIPVPGYNCQPMMLMYDYEGCRKVYGLEKSSWLSKEEYNMTAGNPKIIHFCGNMFTRPWFSNSRHPYRNHWRKYHETSQWKDSQPEYRKASFQYAFQMFARKHLPKKNVRNSVRRNAEVLYLSDIQNIKGESKK